MEFRVEKQFPVETWVCHTDRRGGRPTRTEIMSGAGMINNCQSSNRNETMH
ncbi:hypothetical protein GCM10009069_00830 [Algimonas arctica]|uniref:Uncharacterized protein n=1 Tax=Algimonas arctica TaxID=1479486 RepID=A0A8J3G0Q8_9PROT|nr:hypothetical protein GCM10009069_00830 [Algimonas arctica]